MKNLKAKTISVLLTFMAFSNSLIISNAIENKLDTINDEEQNLELIQDRTNEDSEQIINDANNIEDTSTLSTTSSKELEVKNTISQATTITIGKTYTGKTNGNNYNYYKFTVAQDGYIDINFKENQNVRFDFKLEDNSQKSHGTWSTNYGSGTKTVRMGLAKGTYYLRVSKYSTSNPNTQYSFSVNATASNYWEKEFNNSYESSNNITIGNTYNGITDTSGYDYYKFTISKDGYIDINFKESQDVKFDFKLEDESRRSHGMWSTHYGSGTTKVRMGLAKGTYYLRVSKYSTSNQNT